MAPSKTMTAQPTASNDQFDLSHIQGEDYDLEIVLNAWHSATDRLQQTHMTLCEEVRRLSDELEFKNQELARENRLADLGRMASCIAHEVRNCLTPITLYMSLLRRRLPRVSDAHEVVDKLESGFTALEATVNDLLQFTANREPNRQPCLIRKTVDDVCQSLLPQCMAQGIRTQVDVPRHETFWIDDSMVRRALLNLVLNALDAMPDGGELVITSFTSPQAFELEVADSGPGVELQSMKKVLDPFFTTKQGGTGLGLSIVSRIAEAHGGEVVIANCPEGGAAFTLRFPQQPCREAAA